VVSDIFDNGIVRIVLAPAWTNFSWAFLLLSLANIAISTVNLFRPAWTSIRAGVRLDFECLGSGVFCWLLNAPIPAEIGTPDLSSARAVEISNAINSNMAKAFPLAALACVIVIADAGRIIRLKTNRAPFDTKPLAMSFAQSKLCPC
jgi:hypothetical protein